MLLVFIIAVPLLLILYIVFSFKFAKVLLWLSPLFLLGIGIYFLGDTCIQWLKIFGKYGAMWALIALIVSLLLTRKKKNCRIVVSTTCILLATFFSIFYAFKRAEQPIKPLETYTDIKDIVLYRSQGYKITLGNDYKEDIVSLFKETTVMEDLMEEVSRVSLDNSKTWYKLEINLEDDRDVEIIIVPNGSKNNSLMQVSVDGNISYYKSIDNSTDLGVSWFNNTSSEVIHTEIINQYGDSFKALQNSFNAKKTTFSFVVPKGLPDLYEIEIVGRPVDGAMVRFLKDNNKKGWVEGKTYTFDVSGYSAFRYLYLAIRIYDLEFDLINIYDFLPKDLQAEEASEYYKDLNLSF